MRSTTCNLRGFFLKISFVTACPGLVKSFVVAVITKNMMINESYASFFITNQIRL